MPSRKCLSDIAVVLMVVYDVVLLAIAGTSKERAYPHVLVDPASQAGRALRLSAPTYFYEANVREFTV